jgi:hypothetical protein
MVIPALKNDPLRVAVDCVARQLVGVQHWGESSFVSLPFVYPGGSSVTVKLELVEGGFRVSDNGFAYREIESLGMQRSFPNAARAAAEPESLEVDRRTIFVDVPEEELARAIADVAAASWQVATTIVARTTEDDEEDIVADLRERLSGVFGKQVAAEHKIVGQSTSEWEVSAIVKTNSHRTVFHAVSNHPNSVFKASAAFHDLAALHTPPSLVAVVRDRKALGSRFGLLAQAGRVIEVAQPDDVYRRAVA